MKPPPDTSSPPARSISPNSVAWLLVGLAGLALTVGWILEHASQQLVASRIAYIIAYGCGGYFGVVSSLGSIRAREVDVDLLMVLAALGAAWVGAPFEGGMLLFLFSLSNVLQKHAMERSHHAIRALMKLRPSEVRCKVDSEWVLTRVEQVAVGTVVRVRPGESIALDGVILEGESSVDEASITGEAMPVQKAPGERLFAGTLNQQGSLDYRVTQREEDSTLAKIVGLVESAQQKKAHTERMLESAERHYALGVIVFTLLLIAVPPLWGAEFSSSFYRAMTVMVVASPCALVISTPAAFLSAIGGAARSGVLFKGGVHLERIAKIHTIAFDKTGTLTVGKPAVREIIGFETAGSSDSLQRHDADTVLRIAVSLESHSEHPLARAVERCAHERGIAPVDISDFHSIPGKGAWALMQGQGYLIGSLSMFEGLRTVTTGSVRRAVDALLEHPATLMVIGTCDAQGVPTGWIGAITVEDALRPEARQSIASLRSLGVERIVMLTGDQERVAKAIAEEAGLDGYYANLMPAQKMQTIQKLEAQGPVMMVGDGVNDAPALASAHVGVAMGAAGTDVAMETADVVLMSSQLEHLVHALKIARKTQIIVRQNLAFALGVIVVLVVCTLTIGIPLPLGVIGHEGSTVLVCLNGLRLLARQ